MTIFTVKHAESGATCDIDTEEEVVSASLFDTFESVNGELTHWSDVANIESACEALAEWRMDDARSDLHAIGFALVGEVPQAPESDPRREWLVDGEHHVYTFTATDALAIVKATYDHEPEQVRPFTEADRDKMYGEVKL